VTPCRAVTQCPGCRSRSISGAKMVFFPRCGGMGYTEKEDFHSRGGCAQGKRRVGFVLASSASTPSHVHIHPENGSPPSLCTPFHHNKERKPFWHLKCFCSCSLSTALTALQGVTSATEGLSPKQRENREIQEERKKK